MCPLDPNELSKVLRMSYYERSVYVDYLNRTVYNAHNIFFVPDLSQAEFCVATQMTIYGRSGPGHYQSKYRPGC